MDLPLIVTYLSVYIGLVATTFYILVYNNYRKKPQKLFTDEELPTVSVIIPAYNEEKSIAETIESIQKSDYPKSKLEIIVVDDGSNDDTYKIARRYKRKNVHILTKENGGKATALNLGISKAKNEIIFTVDADTFAEKNAIREMVRYFKDKETMVVSPAIVVHDAKSIWQKVQQLEYLLGIFLRKAFSALDSIHVTPGAFSAYRKTFFDKHGGYDEKNITEDLEMALRVQANQYRIANCPEAAVYTIAPRKFKTLMIQRRRWYTGLISNTWKYKKLFSPKYGDLGLVLLPLAWISIFFSVFVFFHFANTAFKVARDEIIFLSSINFDIANSFAISWPVLERAFFLIFTNTVNIFLIFFIVVLGVYLHYAMKKVGKASGLISGLPLFFIFFAMLFGFWWTVSIIYSALNREVSWR